MHCSQSMGTRVLTFRFPQRICRCRGISVPSRWWRVPRARWSRGGVFERARPGPRRTHGATCFDPESGGEGSRPPEVCTKHLSTQEKKTYSEQLNSIKGNWNSTGIWFVETEHDKIFIRYSSIIWIVVLHWNEQVVLFNLSKEKDECQCVMVWFARNALLICKKKTPLLCN